MTIRNIAVAALVLASSCTLATPTPSTSDKAQQQPEKRGFRAEAHRYEPSIRKRATGDVSANFDGGGWILPVTIGGEKVILNIDTGSSDLWTASTLMPAAQQKTVTSGYIFNPSKSSTFKYMQGSTFGIAYADGSGASGRVGIDNVNIGGANVTMPFGVCNDLKYGGGGSGTRDTDGPVGLGFGQENSIRPNPQCTFMECLEPYVPEPIFSTHFRPDSKGFVDFGCVNASAYTGPVTSIKIDNSTGQWEANNVQFGHAGKVFPASPIQMDFDTGTASLSVPAAVAKAYFALVPGSGQDSSGAYTYPCGHNLPDFDYIFSEVNSGPKTVTIAGNHLKNTVNPGNNGKTCYTWIGTTTGGGNAGYPFYISKYMMFNQKVPSLAFAKQRDQN